MTIADRSAPQASPLARLSHQPYVLLSLTSLFWAGNLVFGRLVAGHVPPVTLTCIRWGGACILLLPFAWPHLKRDWPAMSKQLPLLVVLSATGFAINNLLAYWGLQFTEALNALLIQSSGPLWVALWSLVLFGTRLTLAQAAGIAISLGGVFVIILRGDVTALATIHLNKGDIMITGALVAFGIYSALMPKRPQIHQLSLIIFTTGCGALLLVPVTIWEISTGFTLTFDMISMLAIVYVVIFPSALGYLFFNRGVELIGPNRAAPFFHLMPVFGSAMAILFLGETPRLYHLVGYAMVLAGIVIASRRRSTLPITPMKEEF